MRAKAECMVARARAWWKERGRLAPPHLIAWRLLWLLPIVTARIIFSATIFCGYGPDSAARAWRDTR